MFLVVLGRTPKLSLAELEIIFGASNVTPLSDDLALVDAKTIDIDRLGGTIKAGKIIKEPITNYLANLPPGKITLGLSDYSRNATAKSSQTQALKFKSVLKRHGRSVRIVPNNATPALSSATSHHNQLGEKTNHIEIITFQKHVALSIGTQNITAYAKRDQARPARDVATGMLPPKLAQILINLAAGPAATGRLLDPFCGTGTVLQEALLMGYSVYGTDLSEKMIKYSKRNLDWLASSKRNHKISISKEAVEEGPARPLLPAEREGRCPVKTGAAPEVSSEEMIFCDYVLEQGDATNFKWKKPIDFIASETYLGQPFSALPSGVKMKEVQFATKNTLLAFLKNIHPQIKSGTPLALSVPAWRRPDKTFSHFDIVDEIDKLSYNVHKFKHATESELLYYREGQITARQIIVLKRV